MAGVDISASTSGAASAELESQVKKSGGDPSGIDPKKVAEAVAAGAATAGCAAVGLGPAAAICGWAGAKLAGFVIDKVGPALGKAFKGLGRALGFGKERPKPTLIPAKGSDEWFRKNKAASRIGRVRTDDLLAAAVEKLQSIHNELEIPGPYSTKDVVKRLKEVHGLPVKNRHSFGLSAFPKPEPPRYNVDYSDADECTFRESSPGAWEVEPRNGFIDCKQRRESAGPWNNYWWAPDFEADYYKQGGKAVKDAEAFIGSSKTKDSQRAPVAKALDTRVQEWDAKNVKPWEEKLRQAYAGEAASIAAAAISNRAAEEFGMAAKDAAKPPPKPRPRRPPTLGRSALSRAMDGLTDEEKARYRACLRRKGAAASAYIDQLRRRGMTRDQALVEWRKSPYFRVDCRAEATGIKRVTMQDLAEIQKSQRSLWLWAAGGVAAGVGLHLLTRGRRKTS